MVKLHDDGNCGTVSCGRGASNHINKLVVEQACVATCILNERLLRGSQPLGEVRSVHLYSRLVYLLFRVGGVERELLSV